MMTMMVMMMMIMMMMMIDGDDDDDDDDDYNDHDSNHYLQDLIHNIQSSDDYLFRIPRQLPSLKLT